MLVNVLMPVEVSKYDVLDQLSSLQFFIAYKFPDVILITLFATSLVASSLLGAFKSYMHIMSLVTGTVNPSCCIISK